MKDQLEVVLFETPSALRESILMGMLSFLGVRYHSSLDIIGECVHCLQTTISLVLSAVSGERCSLLRRISLFSADCSIPIMMYDPSTKSKEGKGEKGAEQSVSLEEVYLMSSGCCSILSGLRLMVVILGRRLASIPEHTPETLQAVCCTCVNNSALSVMCEALRGRLPALQKSPVRNLANRRYM